MVDVVSKEKRSAMMSGISGKNTKPEIMVRKFLYSHGFRYRLHAKTLSGRPDLVLKKHGLAIFVHGCFWHRHQNCKYTTLPATRTEFWKAKFHENQIRDRSNVTKLMDQGWRIIIFWECALKSDMDSNLENLHKAILNQNLEYLEIP
jgi:DNA mismatch endonuclease (patch repair protein)